jgi:endoglucanase
MKALSILLLSGFLINGAVLPMQGFSASCLRGINLSGAEFGTRGGRIDREYTYPGNRTLAYFAGKGFDSIRLPFLWERLQPALMAPLDDAELDRLRAAVALARSHGMAVVLDPHNYARYDGELVGSQKVPDAAFADFWSRLASVFANQPDIHFGLMNEPNRMNTAQWLKAANAAVLAIRNQAGANNLVLVPGNAWSGAHSWFGALEGGSNADIMKDFEDPAHHFAFEVHQYLDSDFSGTHESCERAGDAAAALDAYTAWLRKNSYRGYLGEFGGSGDSACIRGLEAMLDIVEKNRDVWMGWSYWVAGDWWPESEALNIQPTQAGDRPQLAGLARALSGARGKLEKCSAP